MFNLFNRKPQPTTSNGTVNRIRGWITPASDYYVLYEELTHAPHLLVAGATGSGKSTVIEGMIYTLLARHSPARARFILVDTKRVALSHLKHLPHVLRYADSVGAAEEALMLASRIMEDRFSQMQRKGVREYTGGADLYIVIDEAGDLLTSSRKKQITALIQHITMLGRAAKVHLWLGSQVVTRDVISSAVKANIDCREALRTATAQESRNICGVSGAEQFPSPIQTGKALGLIRNGADIKTWNLPRYTEEQIAYLIDWWTDGKKSVAA